jgi:hypothetical protein
VSLYPSPAPWWPCGLPVRIHTHKTKWTACEPQRTTDIRQICPLVFSTPNFP